MDRSTKEDESTYTQNSVKNIIQNCSGFLMMGKKKYPTGPKTNKSCFTGGINSSTKSSLPDIQEENEMTLRRDLYKARDLAHDDFEKIKESYNVYYDSIVKQRSA